MRVLIVGGGGREHALAWAVSESPLLSKLYIAPGNGGTEVLGKNVPIDPTDIDSLIRFAAGNSVDLTIVGPEAPLVGGIVDRFEEGGLVCFGPARKAAMLEGSKVFAKEFMRRHGIPTADFEIFNHPDDAKDFVRERGAPVVVKADGLAQGKGVCVAQTVDEAQQVIGDMMVEGKFGASGKRVVVEEMLAGEELSVHAVCSGKEAVLLPSSQDHKRIFDGDKGPNTGGMGAYAPVPFIDAKEREKIFSTAIKPVLDGMAEDGTPYSGVLYAGLMMTGSGAKVLEFNVRFGDPESQVILPLIKSDLLQLLSQSASGELPETVELRDDMSAAAVVMASKGYPGSYEKGFPIRGVDTVANKRRHVFHAGTRRTQKGWETSGGRVLAVTALGKSLPEALAYAYEGVAKIDFEGAFFRRDIGKKALQKST